MQEIAKVDQRTRVEQTTVDLVLHRLFNADNVPPALIESVRQYQHQLLNKGITQSIDFNQAVVNECRIDMGNMTLALQSSLAKNELANRISQLSLMNTSHAVNPGHLNWQFTGNNQFNHITIRIEERTWEVEFARLQRPIYSQFQPDKASLKTQAHQEIYQQLCDALKPIDPSAPAQTVLLQGHSGLGKTHCAQHYFYHRARKQHQMVAWLSGCSEEAFLKDWRTLAQQLRNIDSSQSEQNDESVIRNWCENQLGQWLFIIDEVNLKSEWLNAYLPQSGGQVLITTHRPHYQLQQNQITLPFSPLSMADSQELLQAYVGGYWQASGYPQEQEALNYLSITLGGFPVALIQMALVVHKKGLSFARIADQFRQPALRVCLLNDTIYDQLKDQTFIKVTKKGWQQLLAYLAERYPQLSPTQHAYHIKQFVDCLQTQMLPSPFQGISCNTISNDFVIDYWQGIYLSLAMVPFNEKDLVAWLHCLPLVFNNETQQWQVSLAGMSALEYQQQEKPLPIPVSSSLISPQKIAKIHMQNEQFQMPKIPKGIHLSFSLKDSTLKHTEITISAVGKLSEFSVWQLPTINPYFIPRPTLTQALAEKLPQRKAGEASAQLLLTAATGMGGIGKTELARHFITNPDLSSHYQRRFWFTATAESQLRIQFHHLAHYLGLIDSNKYIEDKELITHIHKWLSIHPGWLMVLDNADDYNSIATWIPKEGGAVLVTTREPTPGVLSSEQIVPVPLLTHEEAVMWLSQLSGRNLDYLIKQEKDAVESLVKDLGYLPLAIAQAAAYLREQSTLTIKNYYTRFITLLAEPSLAKQEDLQNDSDAYSRKVVTSTWILSLCAIEEAAKARHLAPLAQPLLTACAYLASKNIPVFLLETFLKEFYQVEPTLIEYVVDDYIGQLVRYSLLERNSTNNMVSMHTLVQEVIINSQSNEKKQTYLVNVIQILKNIFPYQEIQQLEDFAKQRCLLPHLEKVLWRVEEWSIHLKIDQDTLERELFVPLLVLSAHGYRNLGDAHKQKKLLRRALVIKEQHYGKDHPIVASTLINLGNAYESLGDVRGKKQLLERALLIEEQHYGKDHPIVATTLNNLANAYGKLGDVRGKKQLLERTLSILEERYGKNYPEVARTLANLANAIGDLGNARKKKELLEQVLVIEKQHYGKDHPEVAASLNNLANAYGALGDVHKKKELLEQALMIKEQHYGKDHPEVVSILENLANAYGALGDTHQQKALLQQVLMIKEQHYGKDHPEVASTLGNLANAYGVLGDVHKQKQLLERVLMILKQRNGKDDLKIAIALNNLVFVYVKLAEWLAAKKIAEHAYQIFSTHPDAGLQHPYTQTVKENLKAINAKLTTFSPEQLSILYSQQQNAIQNNNHYQNTIDEENDELQQALELSIQLQDDKNTLDEEDELQQALELSLHLSQSKQADNKNNPLLRNSSSLTQHGIFASHVDINQNNTLNVFKQQKAQDNYGTNFIAISLNSELKPVEKYLSEAESSDSDDEIAESDLSEEVVELRTNLIQANK